jgi:hypothetical protein
MLSSGLYPVYLQRLHLRVSIYEEETRREKSYKSKALYVFGFKNKKNTNLGQITDI